MLSLNLPVFDTKIATRNGKNVIFDVIRRRYVALTPEEWVRQHFVHFLIVHKGYPSSLMANEVLLNLNGTKKRCDTVLYKRDLSARMIVEYKAPHIEITQAVFDQIMAIIQVGDEAVSIINRDGDTFNVGDWTIKAVLDASKVPELAVSHRTEQAVFSYGTDNPALNGNFYSRQYTGSSLLYDEIDGAYQVVEMTDRSPISTRVVNQ